MATHVHTPPKLENGLNKDLPKRLVLACGALVYELVELIKRNPAVSDSIDLHCLPAHLHNTPQFIAHQVDEFLTKHSNAYTDLFVGYGDCGTAGELDKVLVKHGAQRLPGAHCYEFFAGNTVFECMLEEELGTFFLTDYLVKFFDRLVLEGLGINEQPELRDLYFKHYKKLVYLAQSHDLELQKLARQQAKQLGLVYEYRFVGTMGLESTIDFPLKENFSKQQISIEVNHD